MPKGQAIHCAVAGRNLSSDGVQNLKRVFTDSQHTVELYDIGAGPHTKEMLIAYLPKEKNQLVRFCDRIPRTTEDPFRSLYPWRCDNWKSYLEIVNQLHRYTVTAGVIVGDGPTVEWHLARGNIGKHAAKIEVLDRRGGRTSETAYLDLVPCDPCHPPCTTLSVNCPTTTAQGSCRG